MLKLIVTRHGETDWNKRKRNQGHTDIPLNEHGQNQANQLALYLDKKYPIDCIYTSPLLRARETAEICSLNKIPIYEDDKLYDIHFGDWQGLTFDAITTQYPDEYALWDTNPYDSAIPGAIESFLDVYNRTTLFMQNFYKEYEKSNKTILIVTHQLITKLILADALQLPVEFIHRLRVTNCSINLIQATNDKKILYKLNEMPYNTQQQMIEGDIW